MKISTKGRYGVRIMIDLAIYGGNNIPLNLPEIAKREGISEKYLEQIITPLVNSGLIKSVRGKYGGYLLNKPASEIKISEIIKILEGPLFVVDCVSDPKFCKKVNSCGARELWVTLSKKIEEVLSSFTLQDLCNRQIKKKEEVIYYI
jgi:Rrf2 family protein